MLIALLAVGVLSSGSRRPLALVQHYGDSRDDRHPGSVPQPTGAQETRARYGRRTATRVLENLRSYYTRHALTSVVRKHYGYCRHDGSALVGQHSLFTTAILLAFSRWRDRQKYQSPPVLNEHSSEASQATSAAISVGCPKRPMGKRDNMYSICVGVICWKRSVSTKWASRNSPEYRGWSTPCPGIW